jgi:hypothetical protein
LDFSLVVKTPAAVAQLVFSDFQMNPAWQNFLFTMLDLAPLSNKTFNTLGLTLYLFLFFFMVRSTWLVK